MSDNSSLDPQPLLKVEGLTKDFKVRFAGRTKALRAVDSVSFSLKPGETLGLVGESGCGKSTLARMLVQLEPPTSGSILYRGINALEGGRRQRREVSQQIQIVFQDPYDSLNDRMTVADVIAEPWRIVRQAAPARREQPRRAAELLEMVGLTSDLLHRYPGELSGGQRQRVGIARALALTPRVLILDEPVSALDVSAQAQVLNLLRALQEELNLAYLLIAHDLSVVRHFSQHLAVMYLGRIVESGPTEQVYTAPRHPYTEALLAAVPALDPRARQTERLRIHSDVTGGSSIPSGCAFHPRCWKAQEQCSLDSPELLPDGPRAVACHFPLDAPLEIANRAAKRN